MTFKVTGNAPLRKSGLIAGDRVVVSTDKVNAPDGLELNGATHHLYAGVVSSVSDNGSDTETILIKFDEDLPATLDSRFNEACFLTASSRVRNVLNEARSVAVLTPSWGFRNDSVHGPNATVNATQHLVRDGIYAVGVNDAARTNAVMNTETGAAVGNIEDHYDGTTRYHPFGVDNLVNLIPGKDIYEF